MKNYHITYYIRRGEEAQSTPLLGGFTVEAENIMVALLEYRMKLTKGEELPPVTEIKYIIEL